MNTTNLYRVNVIAIDNPDNNCSARQINTLIGVLRNTLTTVAPTRASEVRITLSDCVTTPKIIIAFNLRLGRCQHCPGQPEKWAGEFTTATQKATLMASVEFN